MGRGLVTLSLEDPEGAPRYMIAVIRGVRVGPSPAWLATRLQAIADYNAPLTTLRSALLSWDVETQAAQSGAVETRVSPATASYSSAPLARSIIDSMTLPMLAETAALRDVGELDIGGFTAQASSYAAPGMIADRAQSWSGRSQGFCLPLSPVRR